MLKRIESPIDRILKNKHIDHQYINDKENKNDKEDISELVLIHNSWQQVERNSGET